MMSDQVREQLIRIVEKHGRDILGEPKRVEGLLKDFCPEEPRGMIFAITQSLREGIARELIDSSKRKTLRIEMSRLTKKIQDNLGLKEDISIWAVETIALALGITIKDKPIDTVEKAEGKAPETKPLDLSKLQVTRNEEIEDEKKESVYSTPTSTRKAGKKRRIGLRLFGMFVLIALILVFILISRNKSPVIPTVTRVNVPFGTISQSSSAFSWNGSDPDGTITKYEYRKDGGSWTSNGTGKNYTWSGYSEGSHKFEVRAQDNEGVYSNIISWSFVYDVGNKFPTVTIVSGPSGTISQSSSAFSWNGSDPDGTITKYEYRKDGGTWTSNGTSKNYTWSGYSETSHTFEVRAQDNEGDYSNIISWSFITLPET